MSGRPLAALALALLALGAGSGVDPAAAHGPPSLGLYVATTAVDVKTGPGPQYATIRTFHQGKVFEIVGKQGHWLRVRLSEHEITPGWVDDRFAVAKTPPDDAQRRFPIPGAYLTTTPVEVRNGPGPQHAVVTTIPAGTRVVVLAMEASWLRIASRRGDPPRYIDRGTARLQPAD